MGNATVYGRIDGLNETDEHVSRLSIRLALSGEQWYRVGGVERLVHKNNFLVVDQGQRYSTAYFGSVPLEGMVIAFKPGMADDVSRVLSTSDEKLLDEPFFSHGRPHFFEHTYAMDDVVCAAATDLRAMLLRRRSDDQDEAALVHDRLMEHLVLLQQRAIRASERIGASRRSTRLEIWRRLNRARDLMEACYAQPLSIAEVGASACLSEFHFKRLFKQLFGMPPHRYLVRIRMVRAMELLGIGHQVGFVAQQVGYSDVSAFTRAFRRFHGNAPSLHRRLE